MLIAEIKKRYEVQKITFYLMIFFFMAGIGYAEPFRGEAALIEGSGLTDKFDPKDPETFKKVFDKNINMVEYWVDFPKDTGGMAGIQSVEWFSPDGRLWFKETNDIFDVATLRPKIITRAYCLNIKGLPGGVWGVRFIWNDSLVDQRYFSYGTNREPSGDEIVKLKNEIKTYDDMAALADKQYEYKISSYFLSDSKAFFGQQRVYQPTFFIKPGEKTKYLLNVYGGDMALSPALFLYIFSPDGKLYMTDRLYIERASGSIHYYAKFKKNIELNANCESGLWKLVAYYANDDKIVDEKYFYVGSNPGKQMTKEEINELENKIGKNLIFDSLPDYTKKEVMKYRQLNQNQKYNIIRIKNGMSKDDVLKLLGQPNKVDDKKYDDAVVWVYKDLDKAIAKGIDSSSYGTSISRNGLAGVILHTVISAGVGAMMANELDVITKDSVVVGVRGSVPSR